MRHARRVMELAGPEDHFLRGAGGGFLGLAALAAGDVQEAQATFSEAMRSLHAAGNLVDALDGTIVPRGHVGGRWDGRAAPGGSARRRCRPPPSEATRTCGPPPTCTLVWPSSTVSSTTSRARRRTSRPRGCSLNDIHHREPAPTVRGHGAGARRPRRLRCRTAPARRGRGALPARLLPRRPPHRGDEGPRADRSRATWTSAASWAAERGVSRRRRAGVPARVRAPDAGAARSRPAPRRCGQLPPRSPPCWACSNGCTQQPRTPGGTAASSRSGCSEALAHQEPTATCRRRWPRCAVPSPRRPSRTATSGCSSTRASRC